MDLQWFNVVADNLIMTGAIVGGVWYGIRSIYKVARNVEKLVDQSEENKKQAAALAVDLRAHVCMEENRDRLRDQQLEVIMKEMTPNGGSSMKDVINATKSQLTEVHTRVAVLEQWKADHNADVAPIVKSVVEMAKKNPPRRRK